MEGLTKKVNLEDITLKKIFCERMDDKDSEKINERIRKVSYKIITHDSENLDLELNVADVYFGIRCEATFNIAFTVNERIDSSEIIPKNIINILYPCSSIVSMLNATISERIFGYPFILQPFFEEEDFE